MAQNYAKKVKGLRRGKKMAKKLHKYFFWTLTGFLILVFGSALLYWKLESKANDTFIESLWTVMFTLIGQGEFADNPSTLIGRVIVFMLSVVGISVLGVLLSEILTRIMQSSLRNMLGLNACRYEGHTILCGWNARAELLLKELLASGKKVAVICPTKPTELSHYDAFYVSGEPTNDARLIQAGIERADSAIIFADKKENLTNNDVDARTVLTALAIEALRPELYTVVELLEPHNEQHARRAKVDDILLSERVIANVTALCAAQAGISPFIDDIITFSDEGSSLRARDIEPSWDGKTVADLFASLRQGGELPLAVMSLDASHGVEEWVPQINPPDDAVVKLPMRVVLISRNQKSKS